MLTLAISLYVISSARTFSSFHLNTHTLSLSVLTQLAEL